MTTESYIEKAELILERTHDGDDLAPHELKLVETVVNGWMTEAGEVAFEALYQSVAAGAYKKPWLHGIEHLTIDHEGYVFWKGKVVEHYSFRDFERERKAAIQLAKKCQLLDERGELVNMNSVVRMKLEDE